MVGGSTLSRMRWALGAAAVLAVYEYDDVRIYIVYVLRYTLSKKVGAVVAQS